MSTTTDGTILFPWRGGRAPEVTLREGHTIPRDDLLRAECSLSGPLPEARVIIGAAGAGVLIGAAGALWADLFGLPDRAAAMFTLAPVGFVILVLVGLILWGAVIAPLLDAAYARKFTRKYADQYTVIGTAAQRDARTREVLNDAAKKGAISEVDAIVYGRLLSSTR